MRKYLCLNYFILTLMFTNLIVHEDEDLGKHVYAGQEPSHCTLKY